MKPLKKLENMKDKFKNNDFFKDDNEDEKDKKRIIIYIIIIVILLLLLITSCTSGLFGKIGNIFRNEGNYTIDKDSNQKEEILNQNLKFDSELYEMSVSENNLKIGFSYEGIAPESFTCVTSDASIATCYVSDGYVVINPKNSGDVSVYLQTTTNGKIYKASTKVNIGDATRRIELARNSSTIWLGCSPYRSIPFSLIGLTGEVTAVSSDDSVVTARIENGFLKLKGLKSGTAVITLSVTYNGREYTATFDVTVKDGTNPNAVLPGSNTRPGTGTKPGNTNPENPSTGDPGEENPDKPNPPVIDENASDSTLRSLTSNQGTFSKLGNSYTLGVSAWTNSIILNPVPTHPDATMACSYKRADKDTFEPVNCTESLSLKSGDNVVMITVTSADKKSTTDYTVTINKAKQNYLKDIKLDGTSLYDFDKEKLSYEVYVASDTSMLPISVEPFSSDAVITYLYNGVKYDSLDKLNLLTGPNSLKIYVTNKGETRTYELLINRPRSDVDTPDTNSYLKNLSITSNQGVIPFEFDPFIDTYTIGVNSNVNTLDFVATPSSPNATVTYLYNGSTYTTEELNDVVLQDGPNKVVVQVTNNGSNHTYTVNINKETMNSSNVLKDLRIDGKTIEGFNENTLEYYITIPEDGPSSVLVQGIAKNPNTVVTYSNNVDVNGNVNLNPGNNNVTIKAGNRDYVVHIYKESSTLSSDTSLKSVKVMVPGEDTPRDITSTFKTTVGSDVDSVKLDITPANGAKITLSGNVEADGTIKLNPGVNTIIASVTAEDGTKNTYEITIEREKEIVIDPDNPTITSITVNGVVKDLTSGSTTVEIARDEEVTISGVNAINALVRYTYNGKTFTDVNKLNEEINKTIKNGTNTVAVEVYNEEGTNTYMVYLIKDKNYLNFNASGDISESYEFEKVDETNYNLTIPYNENNLKLDVIPMDAGNTNVTYILNNKEITLAELSGALKLYNNVLKIKASSYDNKVNREYTINITKPTRSIEVVSVPSSCYLEDGICEITFKVMENDGVNSYVVLDNVSAKVNHSDVSISDIEYTDEGIGSVVLKANDTMTPANVNVMLEIPGYTSVDKTVEFKLHDDYELYAKSNIYNMNLMPNVGNKAEQTIVLYSQDRAMFKGAVDSKYEGNVLTIWEVANPNTKIEVTVSGDVDSIDSLEYNPSASELGPTSLPIKITASSVGQVTLEVKGMVRGVPITNITNNKITLQIGQKYIVNLYANGGAFDILSQEKDQDGNLIEQKQSYVLDLGETINLKEVEPIKGADKDNCTYYAFAGYSLTRTGAIETYPNDTFTAGTSSITAVTDLYAIYDESKALDTNDKIFKTYWIFDPDLFRNEAANNQTLIYPGASGTYKIELTNDTGNDIKIVGLTLAEDTVCVDDGCLNMGYIVKYSAKNDNDFTYYFGNNTNATCGVNRDEYCNGNYFVLNKGANTTHNVEEYSIPNGDEIIIQNGRFADVYLYWKWVEINNSLDTQIGKKAATTDEETINDIYSLSFGIHYQNVNNTCPIE